MNTQTELKKWAKALPKYAPGFFQYNPTKDATGDRTLAYRAVLDLFQGTEQGLVSSQDYETRLLILAFAQAMDETGDLIVSGEQPTDYGC